MFVRKSKYNQVKKECEQLLASQLSLEELRHLNNVLKDNKEMKRELSKRKSSNSSQFTKSELRAISILCHPDKHRGGHGELALEISKKVNSIKD